MNTYQSSFMPKFTEKEEKTSNRMNGRDWELGDCLFITWLLLVPKQKKLWATATALQHLAEGAHCSRKAQASPSPIPDYIKGFKTVFTKEDFDILLEYRC